MQSKIESIKRLKDEDAKVSCHYLLDRGGNVIQMVKEEDEDDFANMESP